MTTNQLMVLLDIWRGTFYRERHMGTVDGDLAFLSRMGLIQSEGESGTKDLTVMGEGLIKVILKVTSLVS